MPARSGVVRLLTVQPRCDPREEKARMMAVDAVHGASINFGGGGRMIRCPSRTEVMSVMTFTRPGKLLVYCSVYCGEGHDMMKGAIIVA